MLRTYYVSELFGAIQGRFGEIAFTTAEIPTIKAVSGITKSSTRGRIAVARQKLLGIAFHALAKHTPHSANKEEPRSIRAKAAESLISTSGKLKSGGKECGTANRWATDLCPSWWRG